MSRRPLSLTIIGWLFVGIGLTGFGRHGWDVVTGRVPFDGDALWALGSGLVALAGGALLLRDMNWARWVVVAWLVFHVCLSLLHEPLRLAIHAALLVVIGALLFRPANSRWLRERRASS
jgi:hypothetical protein